MGRGDQGDRYRVPDHPYADDLDLFGPGSAFELLGIARTQTGQDTIARWLLEAAAADEVAARQAAVAELAPRLDLQESLTLAGDAIGVDDHTSRLRQWVAAAPWPVLGRARAGLAAITLTVLAAIVWGMAAGPTPLLVRGVLGLLALQAVVVWRLRPRVKAFMHNLEYLAQELALLAGLLRMIRQQTFGSARLVRLQRAVTSEVQDALAGIGRLRQLVGLLRDRNNVIFALPAAGVAWASHLALAIERWRIRHGTHVLSWLDAIGEFEALAALGTYTAERPDRRFPEFVVGSPRFAATALAHPLLPATAVGNDVALGGEAPQLLVVSGSNMSGKSTLLRAVGLNVVFAGMGAPVRATTCRLTSLSLGASIRIHDSLLDGKSRFFAEITRLKQVVDLTRARHGAALFLLDELLGGTNSHDRLRGTEAILTGLTALGAVGLVTTHDLALGQVADALGPRAGNVHFADEFDGGGLRFDYRLRPGLVRTSNALALMQLVGLDVPSA